MPLVLNQRKQVSTEIDTAAFRLQMVSFSDQYLKPAMATLANQVDVQVLKNYQLVYNYAGSVGTMPVTSNTYLNGGAVMDNEAAPRDGMRTLVIGALMHAAIVPALQGLFNPQQTIGEQYKKGLMSMDTLGYDWYMDQNTPTHVVGALGTAGAITSNPLFVSYTQINDANGIATGSSVVMSGWDNSITAILKRGDVIQIAAVNGINPQSRQSTTQLRNFVVQQDVDSSGGAVTANVQPPIVPAGAYQTVDAAPVANAVITVFGVGTGNFGPLANKQTIQGLGYHRDAFTLAFADLPVPGGVDMAGRASDPQLNMSVRFVRAYDPTQDRLVSRLDLLFGTTALRPELAVRYPT